MQNSKCAHFNLHFISPWLVSFTKSCDGGARALHQNKKLAANKVQIAIRPEYIASNESASIKTWAK
jgi:hypothetical protein